MWPLDRPPSPAHARLMSDAETIVVGGRPVGLAALERAYRGPVRVRLTGDARAALAAAAAVVDRIAAADEPVYGVNTGFGKLAQTQIAPNDLTRLQVNLIRSHAAGTGEPLPDPVVRLILLLKLMSLARGHSGVRVAVAEMLADLLAAEVYPVVPGQGSVGASGDLAPLAHLALVLIGEGQARVAGETLPGAEALSRAGLAPLTPAAKEGLALLNGTQVSTALALAGLFEARRNLGAALVAGGLSTDAALGSDKPFDPRIHAVRGQPGQIAIAARFRDLIAGSEIRTSHLDCEKVQDPYSLRCQPQVMGAVLDLMRDTTVRLCIEANAATDNPLVFPGGEPGAGDVISGGNFPAEPVAFAADMLALAVAETGALSERRIAMLTDATISDLPPFLVADAGLNSGFMLGHVTAAALASENKQRAVPASTDSLPTSANQEDHVSMATHGARRLGQMNENTRGILAIELLAAAQGIDFRRPLKSAPTLERVHAALRAKVPNWEEDRVFADDLAAARALIDGALCDFAAEGLLDFD